MKDQLLFTKTYKSRRSNGSNKAYWTKFIKKLESFEGERLSFASSLVEVHSIERIVEIETSVGRGIETH